MSLWTLGRVLGSQSLVSRELRHRLIRGAPIRRIGVHMGQVIDTTDSDFDVVTKSGSWVLVDFWAPWCGPCKMIAPVLSQIASERDITIAKVNTDVNPLSPGRFGVRGIPALILFNNGEVVDRMTGAMPKAGMDSWLDRHMS